MIFDFEGFIGIQNWTMVEDVKGSNKLDLTEQ